MGVLELKKRFESLLYLREDINNVFEALNNKVSILKKIYKELVKNHEHNNNIFGIDAFFFQNKIIESDIKHLKMTHISIDGQMYCSYYNLYQMIKQYTKKEINDEVITNNSNFSREFSPYKHLDTSRVYDITTIKDMHKTIISCIIELESLQSTKESALGNDRRQSELGLNIDNIVYSEVFKISIIKAKIDMFYKHLDVFHKHHTKYYTRLLLKAKLQIGIVSEDIFIKQFSGSGTTDLNKIKSEIADSPTLLLSLGPQENAALKSYIKYDELEENNKEAFNCIVTASTNSSCSDGSGGGRSESDSE